MSGVVAHVWRVRGRGRGCGGTRVAGKVEWKKGRVWMLMKRRYIYLFDKRHDLDNLCTPYVHRPPQFSVTGANCGKEIKFVKFRFFYRRDAIAFNR